MILKLFGVTYLAFYLKGFKKYYIFDCSWFDLPQADVGCHEVEGGVVMMQLWKMKFNYGFKLGLGKPYIGSPECVFIFWFKSKSF